METTYNYEYVYTFPFENYTNNDNIIVKSNYNFN
jgi:hypothetical protein